MKPLTEAAQANVDRGATDGPGTLVCRKCGQPKEENRINSSQCQTCENKRKNDGTARTPVSEPKVPMRSVRTVVPPEVFTTLEHEAVDAGTTLAAHVRDLLIAHTKVDERVALTPPAKTKVDDVTWERVSVWFNATGITGPMLKAKGCRTKAEALAWARTQGFS